MAKSFEQRNLTIKGCGCRFRRHPNTNYINNELEQCEYLCENHFNEYILKLYNEGLENSQVKRGRFT